MNDLQRERLAGGDRDRWSNWHISMKRGDMTTAISYGRNSYGDGPEGDVVRDRSGIDIDDAWLICRAPKMLEALDRIVGRLADIDEDDLSTAEKQILKIANEAIDATDRTKSKYENA